MRCTIWNDWSFRYTWYWILGRRCNLFFFIWVFFKEHSWFKGHQPASQTVIHNPGDYCRDLISANSCQADSNHISIRLKLKSWWFVNVFWIMDDVTCAILLALIAVVADFVIEKSGMHMRWTGSSSKKRTVGSESRNFLIKIS